MIDFAFERRQHLLIDLLRRPPLVLVEKRDRLRAIDLASPAAPRMCSCSKPSVCPASWRTTRRNSDSGVRIVNPSRLNVGSFSAPRGSRCRPTTSSRPCPSGESSRAMRTCPVPLVSLNRTLAVLPHAFMCSRMRRAQILGRVVHELDGQPHAGGRPAPADEHGQTPRAAAPARSASGRRRDAARHWQD